MSDADTRRLYERLYGPFVHMGPEDTAIWLRYLMMGGVRNAPFSYDVRVGIGTSMPPDSSRTSLAVAQALTTKRIDVIWNEDGKVVICELKKYAGSTAIGQLILYRDLYVQTFPTNQPPKMLLITDRLQPDMISTLVANNIEYIEVGE